MRKDRKARPRNQEPRAVGLALMRTRRGLSREQLASTLGIDASEVQAIESGEALAALELRTALMAYFNCTYRDLFETQVMSWTAMGHWWRRARSHVPLLSAAIVGVLILTGALTIALVTALPAGDWVQVERATTVILRRVHRQHPARRASTARHMVGYYLDRPAQDYPDLIRKLKTSAAGGTAWIQPGSFKQTGASRPFVTDC
jgi:DNA-binding XRE family transcriptional regulator